MRRDLDEERFIRGQSRRSMTALGALVFFGFALLSVLVAALVLLLAGLLPGADPQAAAAHKLPGVLVLALLLGSIAYTLARLSSYAAGRALRMALIGLAVGVLPYFFMPLNLAPEPNELRGFAIDRPPTTTSTVPELVKLPVTGEETPESSSSSDTNTPELITWMPTQQSTPAVNLSPAPTWQALYSAVAPLPTLYGAGPYTATFVPGGRRSVPATRRPTATTRPVIFAPTRTPTREPVPTQRPSATQAPSSTPTRVPTATVPPPTATLPPPTATVPPPTATVPPPTATVPPPTATQPPPPTATQPPAPEDTAVPNTDIAEDLLNPDP